MARAISGTLPQNPEVTIVCGIPVRNMKAMVSAYQGVCGESGETISKGDLMLFKANSHLTDTEYVALFPPSKYPHGCDRHIVVLYEKVHTMTDAEWRQRLASNLNIPDFRSKSKTPARAKEGGIKRRSPQRPKHPPSKHQEIILDCLWKSKRHMVTEALAGCAKTTSLQHIAWSLRDKTVKDKTTGKYVSLMHGRKVAYLAYNKRLQTEVDPKMYGTGVMCQTTHAFLLRLLALSKDCIEDSEKLDRDRFLAVLCNRTGKPFNEVSIAGIKKEHPYWTLKDAVLKLVEFTKHWAVMPEWSGTTWIFQPEARAEMDKLITKYEIIIPQIEGEEPKDVRETVVSLAASTIASGAPEPGSMPTRITFEDMLYLPLLLNLELPKYDMILADEVQDFNMCQIILMRRLADAGARLFCVGDPNQAIYFFRGATGDSFTMLADALESSGRGLDRTFLPVNYRSSKAIIRNAQQWTPELQGFREEEGEVRDDVNFAGMLEWLATQDTSSVCILSRTNDPLFQAALETIKEFIRRGVKGKKVCILGKKGVGAPLTKLIRTVTRDADGNTICTTIADKKDKEGNVVERGLYQRLNDYVSQQVELWGKDEQHKEALAKLNSNAECIRVVCEMVRDDKVETAIKIINDLVTDKPEPNCIVFATVHAAKGLEWVNVFVIRMDLFPFPTVVMFDQDGNITERGKEEIHICYVRDTRPIDNLYYIRDWIEKDRMGSVMNVKEYLGMPLDTPVEEDDAVDFWSEDREQIDSLPPLPPRKYVPIAVRLSQSDDNAGEVDFQVHAHEAVYSPPRLALPSPPKILDVKSQNRRKWVDNGKPF